MTAMSLSPASAAASPRLATLRSGADYLGTVLRHLAGNPSSLFGLVVISVLIIMAVFAPLIATQDPYLQDLAAVLQPPSAAHFFGTDEVGRDVFSRIVYGSRITLTIIALVAIIVGPIGLAVGTLAGYFGGWFDTVLMRITDIFLSFPGLILSLAFVAALGAGLENAIVAIALTSWPPIARLARAETLTLRGADYVSAAKLQGASAARIIWKQIVPMCMPSVLVRLTLSMATVILTAAGLGFLGLGAQPPLPEWGAMIAIGRRYMLESWWLVAFPGAAILCVSLAFNLIGDGLRDALDPKQRKGRH
jgi:peptide/nickel transport system permease protein